MKILTVQKKDGKISNVQFAPDKYSLSDIAKKVEEWNGSNNDSKYEYYKVDNDIEKVMEFLIKDRNLDKNRLLSVINDLQEDINDIKSRVDDTCEYIENEIESEETKWK